MARYRIRIHQDCPHKYEPQVRYWFWPFWRSLIEVNGDGGSWWGKCYPTELEARQAIENHRAGRTLADYGGPDYIHVD